MFAESVSPVGYLISTPAPPFVIALVADLAVFIFINPSFIQEIVIIMAGVNVFLLVSRILPTEVEDLKDQSLWPCQIVSPVESPKLAVLRRSSANPHAELVKWVVVCHDLAKLFFIEGADLKNVPVTLSF